MTIPITFAFISRNATIDEELQSALAASDALKTGLAFRARTQCEPTVSFIAIDVVAVEDEGGGKSEDEADGVGGQAAARVRIAMSAGFEDRFMSLPQLLEWSLRHKTCPLLLLAA